MFSMKFWTGEASREIWEGGAYGENAELVSKGLKAVSLAIGGRCMVSRFQRASRLSAI